MPRYDFKCINPDCGKVEERSLAMSEVNDDQICKECGALMKRKFHPVRRVYRKHEGQLLHPDMNSQQAEDTLYNAIEETVDSPD